MLKLVQLGHHCTAPPPFPKTNSDFFTMKYELLQSGRLAFDWNAFLLDFTFTYCMFQLNYGDYREQNVTCTLCSPPLSSSFCFPTFKRLLRRNYLRQIPLIPLLTILPWWRHSQASEMDKIWSISGDIKFQATRRLWRACNIFYIT